MKAAVVHEYGAPLRLEEVATPEPGRGEVLVKVETSGLCHTDIHAAHGDWPVKPPLPLIPGHEGVGIVERVGADVTRVKEGDRVAVPWLGWACGECEACTSGWETLCERQRNTGYSVPGGYAEYVLGSRSVRRPGARCHRSPRRGAADVRRGHDLQGREDVEGAAVRPRRRLRRRRPRPPRLAVREDRGRHGRRGRRDRREAAAREGARRLVHGERRAGRPDRSDPSAGRRRCGDRTRSGSEAVRASVRLAAARRAARAGRPPRGQRA